MIEAIMNFFRRRNLDHIKAAYRKLKLQEKEIATRNKLPWADILTFGVNYKDLQTGNFELDWNEYFVADLMRAGYTGKSDDDMVDQWFTDICRHVVLETYEQASADSGSEIKFGRREYK